MKNFEYIHSRYDNPSLYTIETWLQDGYATNNHIDNVNFDNEEDLVNAILLKRHITIDAVELNERNSSKLMFSKNNILKTLIDYKNKSTSTPIIRRINLTTIYVNIIEVHTHEDADKALELLHKLQ